MSSIKPDLDESQILKILDSKVDNSITSWSQLPHHSTMLNIDKAVAKFAEIVNKGGKILFIHDSDADGLGTYMLTQIYFKYFPYKNIEVVITDRSKGYGFVPDYINSRLDNLPDLIITADNGITSNVACNRAAELGISVIITDHHQVDQFEGLPNAIVVDPHQDADTFSYPDINGTFVYWYFLWAVEDVVKTGINMIQEFLPELCLTTISDVMPLNGINRFVVKEGLKILKTHHRQWTKTFVTIFDKQSDITAEDLAFNLIPAINVTARLTNAEESAMFMTRDNVYESTQWYTYIKSLNDVRKKQQQELMVSIETDYAKWLEAPFIIIPGDTFNKGILGPTAGRIAESYKKPTIILTKSKDGLNYSGSGRSTGEIDLLSLVKNNKFVTQTKTGGHKKAAGVSFPVESLNDFWKQLQIDTNKLDKSLYKDLSKETFGNLSLDLVSYDLYQKMEVYQPFGEQFQKPLFTTKALFKKVTKMGQDKNHYNIILEDSNMNEIRAVNFFFTEKIKKGRLYTFDYVIAEDTFNDVPNAIVLQIKKIYII